MKNTCCKMSHTVSAAVKMKSNRTHFLLVAVISLSLLFVKCGALGASRQHHVMFHTSPKRITLFCHDDFMSVYIPKEQFDNLPSTIYVQDDHGGYHQATAVANFCRYFLKETSSFVILTVASLGCFVKRQKFMTSLTVVIVAPANEGPPKIIQLVNLICERRIKDPKKLAFPEESRQFFCNKNGFNITIPRDATVPPLNLDALWVASDQNHRCFPQKRSSDAVTFSFPFTDCGSRSTIGDGNITYWVSIEAKQPSQKRVIFRGPPFRLTVRCSFALTQMTQLSIRVQQRKSDYTSALKSRGTLRTEMRFAKADSSYRSFYSSSSLPAVTELGQPVYVEVFVAKHEDKDLVLLLEDCWATPTEDPHDPLRWNLLVKGCPFAGDSQRTVVLPVSSEETTNPSLHKWFVVKLFSFVKSPTSDNRVYFHCNTEICKGPNCLQHCSNGIHKLRQLSTGMEQRILSSTVSSGPLLYLP